MPHFNPNQRGMTLVGIIILLVLALTIVVAISDRFIKNIRITAESDSGARATGVAEAAVERLLLSDLPTLDGYITNSNCGSNCSLNITGLDGLSATANVTLSFVGNSSSAFLISLSDQTSEINLQGYGSNKILNVCWNSSQSGSSAPSVYATFIYGTSGNYDADSYAFNSVNSTNTTNRFSVASPNFGYANCFAIAGKSNPRLLRLRSYYSDVDVSVLPDSGEIIPKQGVRLVSTGQFGPSIKTVTVTKTESSLPSDFDYVIMQKSTTEPLSN